MGKPKTKKDRSGEKPRIGCTSCDRVFGSKYERKEHVCRGRD